MKRKKISTKEILIEKIIYRDFITKISKDLNNQIVFEVSNEITTDLAEGIAILMRTQRSDSKVWDIEFVNVELDKIQPQKCLYWLSGGDKEWNTLEHYKKPWNMIYLDYQIEYGCKIIDIIRKSKCLGDVRSEFIKELNLPTLYEFALSKNIVR